MRSDRRAETMATNVTVICQTHCIARRCAAWCCLSSLCGGIGIALSIGDAL